MVIVTPLNNQGVCWAFIADRGIGRCFFPTRCTTGFSLGLTGELEGDKISPSRVNLKEKRCFSFLDTSWVCERVLHWECFPHSCCCSKVESKHKGLIEN